MRRAPLLGAAAAVAAVGGLVAAVFSPTSLAAPAEPHITRLFIPAIKTACLDRIDLPADFDLGYTFTEGGNLATIDHDGTLTGLPSYTLFVFNACLARYPIEPTVELPGDHYSRNLLYDYYSNILEPCLENRVGALPPIPGRADFVKRLYNWDAYRAVAPGRPLEELLDLSAACPALPSYLTPA